MLIKLIHEGFPLSKKEMPAPLAPFWDARFRLTVHEDVVLFENRIVVPTSLRLQSLIFFIPLIKGFMACHYGHKMLSTGQE